MSNCVIKCCQEVGHGVLGGETMTYQYEMGTCDVPLFGKEERERGICRSCHRLGCDPEKVYEGADTDDGWVMTELSDEEIAERLARPPEERERLSVIVNLQRIRPGQYVTPDGRFSVLRTEGRTQSHTRDRRGRKVKGWAVFDERREDEHGFAHIVANYARTLNSAKGEIRRYLRRRGET